MNYDVVYNWYTKQSCEGSAKIARLQLHPLQKMANQTAYKNLTFLLGRVSLTLPTQCSITTMVRVLRI